MNPPTTEDPALAETCSSTNCQEGSGGASHNSTGVLDGIKVACFYPWMPYQPTGAWVRFSCLWKFLLGRGANVTLAFLESGPDAALENFAVRYAGESANSVVRAARMLAANQLTDFKQFSNVEIEFLLWYRSSIYTNAQKLPPFIDEIVRSHDVITCEYPLLAPLLAEYCRKWSKPLVVTSLDILYELHGQHPKAKELLKTAEIEAMRLADALVFCNDSERKLFGEHGLKGVTVLNTGDVEAVEPGQMDASRNSVRAGLKLKTQHYCLFVGSRHGPNIEAVGEFRRIARMMPELTFVIAGNCASAGTEGNLLMLGVVSDQMLDLLYRGALAVVVPLLHGTGGSLKTFQALMYGKAVVSTAAGARSLPVEHEKELLLAPTVNDMPPLIRGLLADTKRRDELGQRARAFAESLDYRRHFEPYAEIVRRLVGPRSDSVARRDRALIVVDNTLTDRIGHHFNYALSLKEECIRQEVPFRAMINAGSEVDVREDLSAIGAFSHGIHDQGVGNPYPPEWGKVRDTYDLLRANDVFAQELATALGSAARTSDVVFVPNATPRQLLGLAALLHNQPAYRLLHYVVVLRYSTVRSLGPITAKKPVVDNEMVESYRLGLQRLAGVDPHCVRFATDSAELAKEYEPLVQRSVEVLPIPHTAISVAEVGSRKELVKAKGKVRVVYLGDAREEKGFEFLPAVAKACAAHEGLRSTEFVFQAFISSHYHLPMAAIIDELDRLKLPNLQLIKSPLSAAEYQTLLESADLVLLPYDAVTYRARTSGPFVEAICANKPVIVPQNSWMSAQLGKSGAGVGFTSGSGTDVARAVRQALMSLPVLTEAAGTLGQTFRGYHNPGNFVAQLMRSAS